MRSPSGHKESDTDEQQNSNDNIADKQRSQESNRHRAASVCFLTYMPHSYPQESWRLSWALEGKPQDRAIHDRKKDQELSPSHLPDSQPRDSLANLLSSSLAHPATSIRPSFPRSKYFSLTSLPPLFSPKD